MKKLLFILILLLLYGCSSTETIIKDRKVEITVPAIKDTLPAVYKGIPQTSEYELDKIFIALPDTARIEAEKEIQSTSKNVKVNIKYFPKKKTFELNVPEIKFDTIITDTTAHTRVGPSFFEKIGYLTVGAASCIIIVILILLGKLWLK